LTVEGLSPEGRVEALSILHSLTKSQEDKCRVVSLGMVAPVTGLLTDMSPGVRAQAANVLASIAVVISGRESLAAYGSIPSIQERLTDSNTKVREAASLALMELSTFADGVEAIVAAETTVQSMVDNLVDEGCTSTAGQAASDLVMYHLVAALASVAKHEQGVEQCITAGAVPKLVELLKRCPPTDRAVVPGRLVRTLSALWMVRAVLTMTIIVLTMTAVYIC
jgi:HEAT repeat protein